MENIFLHELIQVRSSAFQCLHISGVDGDDSNDILNWICILQDISEQIYTIYNEVTN